MKEAFLKYYHSLNQASKLLAYCYNILSQFEFLDIFENNIAFLQHFSIKLSYSSHTLNTKCNCDILIHYSSQNNFTVKSYFGIILLESLDLRCVLEIETINFRHDIQRKLVTSQCISTHLAAILYYKYTSDLLSRYS